jgi:predicted transcriptional regulator
MAAAVRRGHSQHAVARRFGVSLATVQDWLDRARGQRLDRVDWSDRSHAPRAPHRTDRAIEDLVLSPRRELAETSDLGACGAKAIHHALRGRALAGTASGGLCQRGIGAFT